MDCSVSEPPDPKMPQYLFSSSLRKKLLLVGILKAGQVEPTFSSFALVQCRHLHVQRQVVKKHLKVSVYAEV